MTRSDHAPGRSALADGPDPEADRALIARRQAVLGAGYRLFYDRPLHAVRGEGCRLFDAEGRAYLDCYNNVAAVGHGHPGVVAAAAAQMAELNTHTRYLHETVVRYAERLLATLPVEIGRAVFTCTGSEANDLALRVARHATGGTGVVVTAHAYHGVTADLAQMSPSLGAGQPLGAHVRCVAVPPEGPEAGAALAAQVAAAFEDLAAVGHAPALFLCDTILSSDGVFADPPGFLAPAVAASRAAGALFLADEVQPGLGRTGDAFWGFQRHGLVPDLVSCGKPMGNGHPVAALFGRADLIDGFGRAVRYFNTFGGNPVSAAAGLAVLDVIEDEGLQANARDTGRLLRDGLRTLATRHEALGAVRGAGLFLGLDIRADGQPSGARAASIVNALRGRGVLLGATGPAGATLKIRPPLVFGPAEAGEFLDTLDAVLTEG